VASSTATISSASAAPKAAHSGPGWRAANRARRPGGGDAGGAGGAGVAAAAAPADDSASAGADRAAGGAARRGERLVSGARAMTTHSITPPPALHDLGLAVLQ
jgi:hypothetical protein